MHLSYPKFRALKSDGSPAVGYKVYFYVAGTSTLQDTYTDYTLGSANTNPVILDSNGEAAIWLDTALSYKVVLKSDSDVTQWTQDYVGRWQLKTLTLMNDGTNANMLVMDSESASQNISFLFNDAGTQKWTIGKNTVNDFSIYDATAGHTRFAGFQAGKTDIDATGANPTRINFLGGTGGVKFGDGAAGEVASVTNSGLATFNGGVKAGSGGTAVTQIKVYSQTITPSAVNAATAAEQTFTVTGLTTADKVIVNPAATGNSTAVCAARVSAADTIAIQFVNPTAGSLTPGAGTYTIIAIRS